MARAHAIETLDLSEDDSRLLSRLCLARDDLLGEVSERTSTGITFAPTENRLSFRGEDTVDARMEIQQLLDEERILETELDCPPMQATMLWAEGGEDLMRVQQLCHPAQIALQEHPAQLIVAAAGHHLQDAVAKAQAWLAEYTESRVQLSIPTEVISVLQKSVDALA